MHKAWFHMKTKYFPLPLFTFLLLATAAQAANPNDVKQLQSTRQCAGCDLRNANLKGFFLRQADLREADLRGANLNGADLQGAFLKQANLTDADLRNANLADANLADAKLDGTRLKHTVMSDRTVLASKWRTVWMLVKVRLRMTAALSVSTDSAKRTTRSCPERLKTPRRST